jgi:hypothetical protein
VKNPKGQDWTTQIILNPGVTLSEHRDYTIQDLSFLDVLLGQSLSIDKGKDQCSLSGKNNFRSNTSLICGTAGRYFIEAHDLVLNDIFPQSDQILFALIMDREIEIGNPPFQRLGFHPALPTGKVHDFLYSVFSHDQLFYQWNTLEWSQYSL